MLGQLPPKPGRDAILGSVLRTWTQRPEVPEGIPGIFQGTNERFSSPNALRELRKPQGPAAGIHVPEKHIPSSALTASHGVSTRVHSSQQSKQRLHPALPDAGGGRDKASVLTRALASSLQGPCKEEGTQPSKRASCPGTAGRRPGGRRGRGWGRGESWGHRVTVRHRCPQRSSDAQPREAPRGREARAGRKPACTSSGLRAPRGGLGA